MKTVTQILQDSAAYLDLDPSLPTGTELNVRINYAQQAISEWGAAYNWRQLKQHLDITPSMASISMPSNFRNLTGAPRVLTGNGVWDEYPQIQPEEKYNYGTNDNYCYLLGDPSQGYVLVFNNLTSGATLSVPFQRYPSGVATLTDSVEVDDGEYIKMKVISYVLQSRSDDRFPIIDATANQMLSNMIGRENVQNSGGSRSTIKRGASAYSLGRGR